MQFIPNCLDVPRPHVLRSIKSEPCYSNVDEIVHIISDLGTNVIIAEGKIKKAFQTTISDLLR
jgi:hypothetical protein